MRAFAAIFVAVVFGSGIRSQGQSTDAPLFADVTEAAGASMVHRPVVDIMNMGVGTGAAWLDFDGDGDLDLYVTHGQGANVLFRNDGGSFIDVAVSLGAADSMHAGAGVAAGDYDNDGWPDLYLANSDADVLLRNVSGTGFADVTAAAGFPTGERERGTSAAWGDFDGDGFLDLYVTNHMDMQGFSFSSQDRLYHNNGDGTFTDVSSALGIDLISGYGFIGGWTDYDNDGDTDLLLINDCPFGEAGRYRPTLLFRNDGGSDPMEWLFTEVAEEMGASYCRHGMGLAAGDYDRDGWTDYFFTNIGKRTTLLTNDEGQFTDRASEAGVYVGFDPSDPGAPFRGTFTWGANFFDYDRDGWQDLFVTAGSLDLSMNGDTDPQPNVLFHNAGDGTFTDVSTLSGLDLPDKSRTSVYGDYDGDGDLDLFVASVGEPMRLYRNDSGEGQHFLSIRLQGTASNRDGIGARIIVTMPDGLKQYFETRSGSSLGGGDARDAFFGLGSFSLVPSVEVRWPSGSVTIVQDVAADQQLTIVESDTHTQTEITPGIETASLRTYPNPSRGATTIEYRLSWPTPVRLIVHDMLGREVVQLDGGLKAPGLQATSWNGRDATGRPVAGGVYLVSLRYEGKTRTITHVQMGN